MGAGSGSVRVIVEWVGAAHCNCSVKDMREWNRLLMRAVEGCTQAGPQIINDDASENMLSVSVTLETSPFEISRLNLIAVTNISQMLWTLDVSHLEMSSVEGIAFENIPFVVGTLDVSRLGRKRLKDLTTLN